jgi:microcystin-dependent protein
MPDTSTTNILMTNQTEGGNNNTWGTIADANFERIDDKFGNVTLITTTGGSTVLSSTQELVNAIVIDGALASNSTITFSGRGGSWVVRNDTTGYYTVTCKVSGQTGVTVDQGAAVVVFFDNTDIAYANPSAAESTNEVTVASASTADVLGAGSEYVAISGTTTITSFGTGANKRKFVRATGAFKITHNATTLILPGGVDLTTIAGDTFLIVSDSSSNVRIYDYQRSSFVPAAFPIGTVIDYAGSSAPALWLFAYGQDVSRTTYAALFSILGTTYGAGDGSTTFGLPDCNGRVRAGKDNMGGTSANRLTNMSGGLDGDTLGAYGGTESATLTLSHLPSGVTLSATGLTATSSTTSTVSGGTLGGVGDTISFAGGGNNVTATNATPIAVTSTTTTTIGGSVSLGGSSTAHNNVQPTIVFNTIIFAGV